MNKINHQKNRIFTYTMKELKLLIRTPIYFMNCIGTALIFPILIFILPMLQGSQSNIDLSSLGIIPSDFMGIFMDIWPYIIFAGIILGIFVSNLNLISSTAISREGSNISFMKYIPMPLAQQLHAKILSGVIVSVVTDLLMLIAVYALLPVLPIYILALVFVCSLFGVVLGNYVGIIIDILHPKLVWEQETAAVKQNMSGVISMMGGMALAVAMGFVAYLIPYDVIMYGALGILLLLIVLIVVLYKCIGKIAQKAFENY